MHAGGVGDNISTAEKREALAQALKVIGRPLRKVLVLPPDHTRLNSDAGELTRLLYEMLSPKTEVDIMPALGTHSAMTEAQLRMMFGDSIPLARFKVHDWRNGVRQVGDVPGKLIREWSGGLVDYDVRVEVNKQLFAGYDLILSVGQIVPHEVVGMANYTKNIVVGVGRLGHDQQVPLPRRGLRHGAHDGPHRERPCAASSTTPWRLSCATCPSRTCSR